MNHDVFALGHDYGQDFDLSSCGGLADEYRLFKDTKIGKSQQKKSAKDLVLKDAIAQKILSIPVYDSLANWRDISNADLSKIDQSLEFVESFKEALFAARMDGWAMIYPVLKYRHTDRPVKSNQPLDLVVSRREVYISNIVVLSEKIGKKDEVDEDICSPSYGSPIFYTCNDEEIHNSRVVVVGSEFNFFDSISGYIADLHTAGKRVHMAARRNSSYVLKADFAEVRKFLAAKQKVGADTDKSEIEKIAEVKAKTLAVNLMDHNVAVIGQNEQVDQFQAQNIGDLVKAYEQQQFLVAGAADIPALRLFNIKQSGLGQSNFENIENYSQSLDTLRSKMLDKPLRKLDQIFALVNSFEYSPSQWNWNNTKAEDMLLSLRGNNQTEPPQEA